MRASRLLSLLLLLQARGKMTARQLSDTLEVSVRTIYRDVESLHAAGIPLYGDAGPAGGYQLLGGYRTRLTGLSTDEAQALFLAALPGPAAELGLGAVAAAARLKIRAALPPELRDHLGRMQQSFHLDTPGWYGEAEEVPHLPAVADAVWGRRLIRIRYRRWREPTEVERQVAPYGLVLKAGRWYAVARRGTALRTYRVDQILDVEPLDERFERPEDFELAAYWRDYVEDFHSRLHKDQALVRLSPRGAELLPALLGRAVADAVSVNARPDRDGWVRAVVPIESADHAHTEFLKLGAEVEVLEPSDLRDRLTRSARALAELYGDRSPAAAVRSRGH